MYGPSQDVPVATFFQYKHKCVVHYSVDNFESMCGLGTTYQIGYREYIVAILQIGARDFGRYSFHLNNADSIGYSRILILKG